MTATTPITLASIRRTRFQELYVKLLTQAPLADSEKTALLELAVLFINSGDPNVQLLGYRIILFFSNHTESYIPLYDVAVNKGYIPIAKFIETQLANERRDESFFQTFLSAYKEGFRKNDIYLTLQQLQLNESLSEETLSAAVIAPTSYGKSELILDSLSTPDRNICIHCCPARGATGLG